MHHAANSDQSQRRPIAGSPVKSSQNRDGVQVIAPATLFSTLLTLLPTERIDAIAATAISEAIKVYSIAVAPRWSPARRRKSDSMFRLPKRLRHPAEAAPEFNPSIQ
jgi:hypothetical protein